jgi:hypothetical protein
LTRSLRTDEGSKGIHTIGVVTLRPHAGLAAGREALWTVWATSPLVPDDDRVVLGELESERSPDYDPREIPQLLQQFTQLPLPAKYEAYLKFAGQYGMLGVARWVPEDPDRDGIASAPLESLDDWEITVREIRAVGELHGALLADDEAEIARLVHYEDGWLEFSDALAEPREALWEHAGSDPIDSEPWDGGAELTTMPLYAVAYVECEEGDVIEGAWRPLVMHGLEALSWP